LQLLQWKADKLRFLTGFESHFADHEPASVEVQLGFDEARDVVGDGDYDVACELDERVPHVVEDDGRPLAVDDPADAEPEHSSSEDSHVLAEHVVGVEPDRREVSDTLELEDDLDVSRLAAPPLRTVVPPADPLVPLDNHKNNNNDTTTNNSNQDTRKKPCIFQRVLLAVQRYNSVAFKGTFTVPTELD